MQDHRKKKYSIELHIKDDSTAQLQEEINLLKKQIEELNGELGFYRMRRVVDISDLRLAIKSMKLHDVPQQRIERLEAFLKRYIEDGPGS